MYRAHRFVISENKKDLTLALRRLKIIDFVGVDQMFYEKFLDLFGHVGKSNL